MPEQKRATVIIPEGMQSLADANDRSLSQEAKRAMEAHVRKYGPEVVRVLVTKKRRAKS